MKKNLDQRLNYNQQEMKEKGNNNIVIKQIIK